MDTLLFYFPKSPYRKAFRGVAECYAFSCFHDNVGLRDLPAIRHIKGTDAVIVNIDALVGNGVLLFNVVHLDMVDQLSDHALTGCHLSQSSSILLILQRPLLNCHRRS